MSTEFIKSKKGHTSLHRAVRQQYQLSYFLTSEIQEDFSFDYFKNWVERKYQTNDQFLNFVKSVFKTDNFVSFAKYYRNPNAASKLINTRVKKPLSRVFFSEDAYFKYRIKGMDVDFPQELDDDFEHKLFETLLFRHNNIVVHDLSAINTPYRKFLDIDKVVAIDATEDRINKLAYTAKVVIAGEEVVGYAYMDDQAFCFYDKDLKDELIRVEHDLGKCPATFVCKETFGDDPIVRESFFSYLRADLEEYVFLKTLQRMTEPNGAIPITVKIETEEETEEGKDVSVLNGEPMSLEQLSGQVPKKARATANGAGTTLQAGSVVEVPAREKADGGIDTDLARHFLTFYHTPVEALKYLSERIKELEANIITSAIGDYSEGNENSMTEKQVQKTFVSKEDQLRSLSNSLSWARQHSDYVMLALAHGPKNVMVETFYGSDFFWETPEKLYEMLAKSPNAIERKNILLRLAKRRNLFNPEKSRKEVILYKLMPYATDNDFKTALENKAVDPNIFQLQTRFTYWISLFEATYGSIVSFWDSMASGESEKIVLLNQLLLNLIQKSVNNGKK